MILNEGLWISITVDGIEGNISRTYKKHAFLVLYGPEREKGNPWSAYSLFGGLPAEDDNSPFAILFRKLNSISKGIGLEGPYGENHGAVFRRFEYVCSETPAELLRRLSEHGIVIKVTKMDHCGDDAEVETAVKDFNQWIDSDTIFEPNPKIEEVRKKDIDKVYWDARFKEAERKDNLLRKFALFLAMILVPSSIGYCALTSHWWIALAIVVCPILIYACYIYFMLWFARHF